MAEYQADKYYEMLISNCQEITDNHNLGKTYKGITESLLGLKVNQHIIFYRTVKENYVGITRVLHEKIDLKKELPNKKSVAQHR